MALGNHEFDDGVDGLVPFIRNMTDLPILRGLGHLTFFAT
jgi:2',3'-cyclic-nucleotide 2'-phosphodiesterase (5'-nucleotidase family)